jgi:hypothetical protein
MWEMGVMGATSGYIVYPHVPASRSSQTGETSLGLVRPAKRSSITV